LQQEEEVVAIEFTGSPWHFRRNRNLAAAGGGDASGEVASKPITCSHRHQSFATSTA
jgi:hypothetical protein